MGHKKLAYFQSGVSILGNFFLERGANLESWVAHTHPKNTQVHPPPPSSAGGVSTKPFLN